MKNCPDCQDSPLVNTPYSALPGYGFCWECFGYFDLSSGSLIDKRGEKIEMTTEKLKPTKENVFAVCEELSDNYSSKPRLDEMRDRFTRPSSHNITVYRQEWIAENKDRLLAERQSAKHLRSRIKELEVALADKDSELVSCRYKLQALEAENRDRRENSKAYTQRIVELENEIKANKLEAAKVIGMRVVMPEKNRGASEDAWFPFSEDNF